MLLERAASNPDSGGYASTSGPGHRRGPPAQLGV